MSDMLDAVFWFFIKVLLGLYWLALAKHYIKYFWGKFFKPAPKSEEEPQEYMHNRIGPNLFWGINDGSDGEDAETAMAEAKSGEGCEWCRHFDEDTYTCPAFPEGIQESFLQGKEKHYTVVVGQIVAIVFDPVEDKRFNRS